MSQVNVPGSFAVPLTPMGTVTSTTPSFVTAVLMDAVNEATHMVGQVIWADGGTHTVDTTGSSSIQWQTGASTFVSGSTTLKVGLAAVTAGPPGRAANTSDVINFDVSKSLTGGAGGVTASAWQTHVPDSGTKTIATGDFVALGIQMTARGGSDSVTALISNIFSLGETYITGFTGGAYAAVASPPNAIIVANDGVLGWFYGSNVFSALGTVTYNSGSSPNEYGQLYQFPFPCQIYGLLFWVSPAASGDFNAILYSDPLGTPVAQKTRAVTASMLVSNASQKLQQSLFTSPFYLAPNTPIVAALQPSTANSISIVRKNLASAAHRIVDVYGTSGYGVNRSSGAFANANSSLSHYYIGLLVSAFDTGGYPASRLQLGM